VKRINQALQRADQIDHMEGKSGTYWFAPIVADAEAGFGGPLNAFELMKAMIEAGAAAVHFEDQLASEKKCGHLGGKVLVPTQSFIRTLNAARLAADVLDVPTLIVARTDAQAAGLVTSDVDERDRAFLTGERTSEGFFGVKSGLDSAIARALAYAPYADLVWCETSTPDLSEAKRFAEAVRADFPGKLLAYNCSPSFNWKAKLDDATIAKFQRELGAMGYKFLFVTLAGFHALNHSMFRLAKDYRARGMSAYSELQQAEFAAEPMGYTATKHQRGGRHRLLRRGRPGGGRRQVVDDGDAGLHGGGAVQEGRALASPRAATRRLHVGDCARMPPSGRERSEGGSSRAKPSCALRHRLLVGAPRRRRSLPVRRGELPGEGECERPVPRGPSRRSLPDGRRLPAGVDGEHLGVRSGRLLRRSQRVRIQHGLDQSPAPRIPAVARTAARSTASSRSRTRCRRPLRTICPHRTKRTSRTWTTCSTRPRSTAFKCSWIRSRPVAGWSSCSITARPHAATTAATSGLAMRTWTTFCG
jgi:2-methylisocitrate lyase-like PEP mutase family enzyme